MCLFQFSANPQRSKLPGQNAILRHRDPTALEDQHRQVFPAGADSPSTCTGGGNRQLNANLRTSEMHANSRSTSVTQRALQRPKAEPRLRFSLRHAAPDRSARGAAAAGGPEAPPPSAPPARGSRAARRAAGGSGPVRTRPGGSAAARSSGTTGRTPPSAVGTKPWQGQPLGSGPPEASCSAGRLNSPADPPTSEAGTARITDTCNKQATPTGARSLRTRMQILAGRDRGADAARARCLQRLWEDW
ncbi:PREDICTED: SRC kinase signaling inhibitor 1-like [Chinchilla lanigera]|uniref:SRC kinase signaling inhibitor 1-like n=1 Tax=Chinchilla lanigera TaxID=34839 RepID=UPI000696A1D6|nr:PREDICTED: SRC kinase signaling inhibitor 1-like [Chinchilla lanigera]